MACESEREEPDSVCERNLKKDRGGEGGKEEEEEGGDSHYSCWVTSRCSHNSRSWHRTSTIIPSKFTQPGWHTREGEGGKAGEGWSTIRRKERKQRQDELANTQAVRRSGKPSSAERRHQKHSEDHCRRTGDRIYSRHEANSQSGDKGTPDVIQTCDQLTSDSFLRDSLLWVNDVYGERSHHKHFDETQQDCVNKRLHVGG
ncbi:hypothetical protein NQZ68_025026 [Dissostichus eleginoides]|nr:hypothetical protein NQZ68_025026 [Dissostichus eleginoides]